MSRREYKYLLDERTAARVRAEIRGICVPDAHGERYTIDTLYVDTLALDLYHATVENQRVREKLRIRTYDGARTVFLEVKKRVDDVIVKSRAELPRQSWAEILETGDIDRAPDAGVFFARYHRRAYVPCLIVRYERDAYTSTLDDYVRVTFDRDISARPCSYLDFEDRAMTPVDSGVVLELKFSGNAPAWMRNLVRKLELPRLAFSKYARAVETVARPSLRH